MPVSEGALLVLLTLFSALLFAIGVRIVLVFGAWALGFVLLVPTLPAADFPTTAYESLNTFPWVAVPVFVMVGSLINEFGISEDIIDFAGTVAGRLPGTIGNTAVYTAGVFAAITGSNTATTAAVGDALYEEMNEEGYEPVFSAATIAAGGTLGSIIPPSILLILYGVLFNQPVATLFLAGVVPGIAMMLGISAYCSFKAYRNDYGTEVGDSSVGDVLETAWAAKHAFATVALLVGGILVGLFTPSEAAAAAFGYVVLVGHLTGRFTGLKQVFSSLRTGVALTGILVPLYVTAIMVQRNLSFVGLQGIVADAMGSLPETWMVFLAMVVVMLIAGSVLASLPNLILTAPLLAPVATETLGLDPVVWGIVFLMSDAIGFITPPYGLNLFVISSITGEEYVEVAYAALPYLLILIAIWLAFFLVPELNFLV